MLRLNRKVFGMIAFLAISCNVCSFKIAFNKFLSTQAPSSFRLYKKVYHNDDGTFDITSAPKLDFNENYYRVLEVDSNANQKSIKKSFLKMIFKYHPDRIGREAENADDLIALRNQQTMVINCAYRLHFIIIVLHPVFNAPNP